MGRYFANAMSRAVYYDHAADIRRLIKAGVDIEFGGTPGRPDTGPNLLIKSVLFGVRPAAMRVLVELGANVNIQHKGQTPLHIVCGRSDADAADLLLQSGADESIKDRNGKTASECVPDSANIPEHYRQQIQQIKRLTKLLAQARAWRRRGFVVMCRAHQDRLRLVAEIPDTAAEAIGQRRKRASRRARRGQVEVEVGRAHGGGMCTRSRAWGKCIRFDGVAAWLMAVADEDVFRNIVGFL